jgi:hypothetical protein
LRGKGHGEGGKTEYSKNSAHKSSLDQPTEMLLLWTPAEAKWFSRKGKTPLSTPFERSTGEILHDPPQMILKKRVSAKILL